MTNKLEKQENGSFDDTLLYKATNITIRAYESEAGMVFRVTYWRRNGEQLHIGKIVPPSEQDGNRMYMPPRFAKSLLASFKGEDEKIQALVREGFKSMGWI